MNEIKFKYYINIGSKIASSVYNLDQIEQRIFTHDKSNEIARCQYIGLRDAKRTEEFPEGEEIYTGDILKHTFAELVEWVVSFKDGAFGITNLNCSTFYPCDSSTFFIDREIIGNIHEGEEKC